MNNQNTDNNRNNKNKKMAPRHLGRILQLQTLTSCRTISQQSKLINTTQIDNKIVHPNCCYQPAASYRSSPSPVHEISTVEPAQPIASHQPQSQAVIASNAQHKNRRRQCLASATRLTHTVSNAMQQAMGPYQPISKRSECRQNVCAPPSPLRCTAPYAAIALSEVSFSFFFAIWSFLLPLGVF